MAILRPRDFGSISLDCFARDQPGPLALTQPFTGASGFNHRHTETRESFSTMPNQPVAGTKPDGQKLPAIVNLDIQEVAVDSKQTQSLECGQEASGEYCPTDETETLLMVSVATANPATPDTHRPRYLRGVARTKQTQRRHTSEASDEEEMQLGQSDEEMQLGQSDEIRITSASSAEEGPVGLSSGPKKEDQNTQS